MNTFPVIEMAIDVRWRLGIIGLGGAPVPVLMLEHPRLGNIYTSMTRESLAALVEAGRAVLAGEMPTEGRA